MFGTLGYISNGRRAPYRDSHFMGTSGNPARRDMYGATVRRETDARGDGTMASGKTLALLERRCMFLEEQEKRRSAEIADMRARLSEASQVETVSASVVEDTVEADDIEPTVKNKRSLAAGVEVQLQYPMRRIRSGEATQIWMRRRRVDPDLASVTYTWLMLFEEQPDRPDRVLVSDFR